MNLPFSKRVFFLQASTVASAEEKFGIDEYSDVIMLTKPVIYISVKEICSTHSVSNMQIEELNVFPLNFATIHPLLTVQEHDLQPSILFLTVQEHDIIMNNIPAKERHIDRKKLPIPPIHKPQNIYAMTMSLLI